MTIRGWGELTWGMTVEEVEEIDPHHYWDEDVDEGYRQIYRGIELFGLELTLTLRFKEGEGLYMVSLFDMHEPTMYQKELILEIFNTLKAKYGQGSSVEYDYEEEEEWGYPVKSSARSEGHLNIQHLWRFKETIIEYDGGASGEIIGPIGTNPRSLFVSIRYSAIDLSNYNKL